ncbi:phage portal protein [Ammoniphilus oxalaticus]|uniref:Phage portal protein n=1 Tax=Ammoniphilus oxalaticus TaxID=66863 RepID=A0A419SFI6_9BACL|nr:phage portal protein [Ammoniphilus oxalaticus]RKD22546.1 phage portal protein [Ammoniphilus oxalaticus]
MGSFAAFMKGNVRQAENVKLKLERFDELIELRPIGSKEDDEIKSNCFVNKLGRKGKQERVFDPIKYNRGISVASIVSPDLNNEELQNSYGVRGADNLFAEMFLAGEANQILEEVMEISGIGDDINDDVEEAKN